MDIPQAHRIDGDVRHGMSRRTALRRLGGGGLALGLALAGGGARAAVAQAATPTSDGPCDLTCQSLADRVAAAMTAQAQQADIDVDVNHIAFSAIGDNLVVVASAVGRAPGLSEPGPMAFAYFAFSSIACGDLGSGYYTTERRFLCDAPPY